jgi:deferrochelatase/peroxidase EfeB
LTPLETPASGSSAAGSTTTAASAAGQLDQGLVFVAFNQDPSRQFAAIAQRLGDEAMIDYVTPVGGGYFFVPPGVHGPDDWVGSELLAA